MHGLNGLLDELLVKSHGLVFFAARIHRESKQDKNLNQKRKRWKALSFRRTHVTVFTAYRRATTGLALGFLLMTRESVDGILGLAGVAAMSHDHICLIYLPVSCGRHELNSAPTDLKHISVVKYRRCKTHVMGSYDVRLDECRAHEPLGGRLLLSWCELLRGSSGGGGGWFRRREWRARLSSVQFVWCGVMVDLLGSIWQGLLGCRDLGRAEVNHIRDGSV